LGAGISGSATHALEMLHSTSSQWDSKYSVDSEEVEKSCKKRRKQTVATLASAASLNAIRNAGLSEYNLCDAYLILGITYGRSEGIDKALRKASALRLKDYCDPLWFVNSITSVIPGQAALETGIGGGTFAINTGDVSGIDAVGLAHQMVLSGLTKLIIGGGADSAKAFHISGSNTISNVDNKNKLKDGCGVIVLSSPTHSFARKKSSNVRLYSYANKCVNSRDFDKQVQAMVYRCLSQSGLLHENLFMIVTGKANDPMAMSVKKHFSPKFKKLVSIDSTIQVPPNVLGIFASIYAINVLNQQLSQRKNDKNEKKHVIIVIASKKTGQCSCLVFAGG